MIDAETYNYSSPVAQLLILGKPDASTFDKENWLDYLARGLNTEHIPDLIRMAIDEQLNRGDEDNPATWAPVHAWRALGQMRAEAAAEPLLSLFELADVWYEWVIDELPVIYGMIGTAALPVLTAYIADRKYAEEPRAYAVLAIECIGKDLPDARSASIGILSKYLESFQKEEYYLNATLIGSLAKLDAKEAAPLMELAYAADAVDTSLIGDWESIQEEMGLLSPEKIEELRQRREAEAQRRQEILSKPLTHSEPFSLMPGVSPFEIATPSDSYWRQTPQPSASKKAKHKDKVAKQARKKNRKR